MQKKRLVLVAASDFSVTSRINDVARKLGLDVYFLRRPSEVFRDFSVQPDMLIVDLNDRVIDVMDLIERVRKDSKFSSLPILGFLSHHQLVLKEKAEKAGCSLVVPRDLFAEKIKIFLESGL